MQSSDLTALALCVHRGLVTSDLGLETDSDADEEAETLVLPVEKVGDENTELVRELFNLIDTDGAVNQIRNATARTLLLQDILLTGWRCAWWWWVGHRERGDRFRRVLQRAPPARCPAAEGGGRHDR